MQVKLIFTYILGYSRKNPNGGLRIYFFENPSWNFSYFYFTPGNSRQNKAQLMDIPQNYVRSLENSKAKNKDPWKFYIIFSWSPLEILFCFSLTPGNSTCYIFDTPGNSISSTPHVWIFLE